MVNGRVGTIFSQSITVTRVILVSVRRNLISVFKISAHLPQSTAKFYNY